MFRKSVRQGIPGMWFPEAITRGKTAAESKTMSGHFLMYLFMGDPTLMVLKCRAIRTTETARMLFYVREKWSVEPGPAR
jgi:hypothetical protein